MGRSAAGCRSAHAQPSGGRGATDVLAVRAMSTTSDSTAAAVGGPPAPCPNCNEDPSASPRMKIALEAPPTPASRLRRGIMVGCTRASTPPSSSFAIARSLMV